jgi:glycosyltransferase involved in cell wall biosynthesis
MTTVALDATYSTGRELTGVGVYSREIAWGLAKRHAESRFLFCYRPHRVLKSLNDRLPRNGRRRLLRYGGVPKADVFHALNQRVDSGASKVPIVVTFHDLFVLTGDYSSAEFRERFAEQARAAAARADKIIAVSAFTAGQVQDLLNVSADRIRVVHHGTVMPLGEPPPDESRENLILHVGAIQKRKNLLRLIEAFERASANVPSDRPGPSRDRQGADPWSLVLAGSDGWQSDEVRERIAKSPVADRISITGYVTNEQLEDLYRKARVFAFPSLDEGFGIPVIEAMARGVPVLTSNKSALPEAAGDAALLVDPLDVDSIASGLSQLTSDPQLRLDLRTRGLARAAEMTWERAVDKTWQVYEELLSS